MLALGFSNKSALWLAACFTRLDGFPMVMLNCLPVHQQLTYKTKFETRVVFSGVKI